MSPDLTHAVSHTMSTRPQNIAFKMQLKPGHTAEYKKRHDELWPELAQALTNAGIYDYSIFLDESTTTLFAVFKRRRGAAFDARFEALDRLPVMQRWWDFMAELMEVEPDNRPKQWSLQRMFSFD